MFNIDQLKSKEIIGKRRLKVVHFDMSGGSQHST